MAMARRRFGLGSAVSDYIATLPFAYASAFPNVDFASLPSSTTFGDLLASGAITPAQFSAVFSGAIPTVASTADDYNAYVKSIQAGIASGMYTPDSLNGVTPQWYVDHMTILNTNATARSGGFNVTSDGQVQEVDAQGNVTGVVPQAPTPGAGTTPPARYIVDGVEFLSTGEVLTVNGITTQGKMLNPDEVTRLINGGHLTQDEIDAVAPPPPPSTDSPVFAGLGFDFSNIPVPVIAGAALLGLLTLSTKRRS